MWIHLVSLGLISGAGGEVNSNQSAGGYDYDEKPKKKRFFIEQNGKLLVFDTPTKALCSISEPDKPKAKKKAEQKQAEPVLTVDLPVVQEYAQVIGQIEQYNAAYNSQHFEQLMALFEQMRDEEDLEALLLAL